jgi:rRNA processing protein Krr1/Pno1
MSFQHSIKIPRERIGALIGKRGKVKQQIEKKCGVAIEIDRRCNHHFFKAGGTHGSVPGH